MVEPEAVPRRGMGREELEILKGPADAGLRAGPTTGGPGWL